jgi:hypothetical protein
MHLRNIDLVKSFALVSGHRHNLTGAQLLQSSCFIDARERVRADIEREKSIILSLPHLYRAHFRWWLPNAGA